MSDDWEHEIRLLESQALNFSARFIQDHAAREFYIRNIREYVDGVQQSVRSGAMTSEQGARAASEMRNKIMWSARNRSSDIGRAAARGLKPDGIPFDAIVQKRARDRFGQAFDALDDVQKRQVFDDVIAGAARDRASVTARVRKMGKASRVILALTVAVSVYNVYTAEDRSRAAQREGVGLAGGFLAGAAAGAAAGIWFGPIGVGVCVLVGGALGAIMADEAFQEVAGTGDRSVDAIVDPHSGMFGVDAEGLAATLVRECGINMHRVHRVFTVLRREEGMASDNVAAAYVERVRDAGGNLHLALKLHAELRRLLIETLEGGITFRREQTLANWLKTL